MSKRRKRGKGEFEDLQCRKECSISTFQNCADIHGKSEYDIILKGKRLGRRGISFGRDVKFLRLETNKITRTERPLLNLNALRVDAVNFTNLKEEHQLRPVIAKANTLLPGLRILQNHVTHTSRTRLGSTSNRYMCKESAKLDTKLALWLRSSLSAAMSHPVVQCLT